MSKGTGIEWTDETWNPVTGCSKVSQGCKYCYAERQWPRMVKLCKAYAGRKFTDVQCHTDRIYKPLRWKRPRMIFVNSMSDLFHEDVPDSFIQTVFEVIRDSEQHIFQILTKRPERMMQFMKETTAAFEQPQNMWLGVSVEDQAAANERIPILLQTPAAVRWLSIEPMIGAIDLEHIQWPQKHKVDVLRRGAWDIPGWHKGFTNHNDMNGINWVVAGGESGPNARPCHPDWIRTLRDQCRLAGVPFLFKQWGEWAPVDLDNSIEITDWMIVDRDGGYDIPDYRAPNEDAGEVAMRFAGKKKAGRLLDGLLHDEYPSNPDTKGGDNHALVK